MFGIVIPVYNEGENVNRAMRACLDEMTKRNIVGHIVFVDDGSSDDKTLSIYDEIMDNDNVSIVLNQHAGQSVAILSGFDYLRDINCDYVGTIDCDLQDPAEELFNMYQTLIATNNDAIQGIRISRQDSFFKIITAKLYYFLLHIITGMNIANGSHFYVVKSDRINDLDVSNIRLSLQVMCNPMDYEYDRYGRSCGESKYNAFDLFKIAISGFKYAFSVKKMKK